VPCTSSGLSEIVGKTSEPAACWRRVVYLDPAFAVDLAKSGASDTQDRQRIRQLWWTNSRRLHQLSSGLPANSVSIPIVGIASNAALTSVTEFATFTALSPPLLRPAPVAARKQGHRASLEADQCFVVADTSPTAFLSLSTTRATDFATSSTTPALRSRATVLAELLAKPRQKLMNAMK
jgi:hypothetical protein